MPLVGASARRPQGRGRQHSITIALGKIGTGDSAYWTFLDFRELPGLIEESLFRTVEAEDQEEVLARGGDPVVLEARPAPSDRNRGPRIRRRSASSWACRRTTARRRCPPCRTARRRQTPSWSRHRQWPTRIPLPAHRRERAVGRLRFRRIVAGRVAQIHQIEGAAAELLRHERRPVKHAAGTRVDPERIVGLIGELVRQAEASSVKTPSTDCLATTG